MSRSVKVFYLFIFSLVCGYTATSQGKDLPQPVTYQFIDLQSGQLLPVSEWVIEEGKELLTPFDLQSGNIKDGKLLELQANSEIPLLAHQNYWLHLQLSSEVQMENWWLNFEYRNFDSYAANTYIQVNASFFEGQQLIYSGKSGFASPGSERDVKSVYGQSLIDLNINDGDTLDVWVQFSGWETPVPLPTIKAEDAAVGIPESPKVDEYQYAMVHGVLIAYILLILFLYIWLREEVYLWFLILLVIRVASEINFSHDFLIRYLYPEHPSLNPYIMSFLVGGFFFTLIQFGRVYINTPLHFPKVDIGLRLLMITWTGLVICVGIFTDIPNILGFFLVFIPSISIFTYLLFSGNKLARFYSIGPIIMVLGITFVHFARGSSAFEGIEGVNPFIQFGLVTVLTLALAYRFQLLNKEKNKAQEERSLQLERINIASSKFVPKTFLNFLGKENILDATLGDYVEKQVNVLFSDIRDYTTLSEQMTPEENFRFVNEFNQEMGPIIQRHKGFVNQYLGDGIMAIFPENAADTLNGAIGMQQALQKFNQQRISINKTPIRMGIGIHSGPLIMGIIGDDQRMDAATISDTVNVASRVEGLTKHFGASILISEAVVQNLSNKTAYNLRYLGLVQVKGKEEVIRLYECFDGDEESIKALKASTSAEFENGLERYYGKAFSLAFDSFKQVLEQNPKDSTAKLFSQKCRILMENGADFNWTGVEMMTNK